MIPRNFKLIAFDFFPIKQAGLPDKMLQIALEPEAASIYVQYLPIERDEARLEMTKIGTKYMVVDIGGDV